MSKYLDIVGLREFWSKTKEYVGTHYKTKDGLNIPEGGLTISSNITTNNTATTFIDTLSQDVNGKITATAKKVKTADLSAFASNSHTHGYLSTTGNLTNTAPVSLIGASLAIRDNSNSNKLAKSNIQFHTGDIQLLSSKGTWVNRSDRIFTDEGLYDSRYKLIQPYVNATDATVNGTKRNIFLSSITQNENGDITPVWKTVDTPDVSGFADTNHTHNELIDKTASHPTKNGGYLVIEPPSDFPLQITTTMQTVMRIWSRKLEGEAQIIINDYDNINRRGIISAHRTYWGPNISCIVARNGDNTYQEYKLGIHGTYGLPYWWIGENCDTTKINSDGLYIPGAMAWLALDKYSDDHLGGILEELQQL